VIDNGLLDFYQQVLGKENVAYARGDRITLTLPGKKSNKIIWIVGVNNKGATDRLKGTPIGGTLADEITTYPETPADMMFARNSLPGALVFCSTNPASKNHWAWKKYVGNQEKQDIDLVRVFAFTLHDNPTMSDERKQYYENMFEGVFKRRNVYGEWAMAEGAVYDMFNDELGKNVFNELPYGPVEIDDPNILGAKKLNYDDAFLCLDYGAGSVTTCAFWVVKKGIINNQYFCVKEWYYDSRKEGKQLRDTQVVTRLKEWLGTDIQYVKAAFIDPSAVNLRNELLAETYYDETGEEQFLFGDVIPAPNAVGPGIQRLSTLIGQYNMRWHSSCANTILEFQDYIWDKREEDKPKKVNDHCPDRDRYGIMGYETYYNFDENEGFAAGGTGSRMMANVKGRR
jgi:PBSX family phage terminase large subunit